MAAAPGPGHVPDRLLRNDGAASSAGGTVRRDDGRTAADLSRPATETHFSEVLTLVHLVHVLLILVLALLTIAFVIAIGGAETGPAEKLALLALIAGCIFLAAQVPKLATRTRRRIQRP
jgi:hypothetical protein